MPDRMPAMMPDTMPATMPHRNQSICPIERQVIVDGRTKVEIHVRTHARTEVGPCVTAHVRQKPVRTFPSFYDRWCVRAQTRFDARTSVRTVCQFVRLICQDICPTFFQIAFQGKDHSKWSDFGGHLFTIKERLWWAAWCEYWSQMMCGMTHDGVISTDEA